MTDWLSDQPQSENPRRRRGAHATGSSGRSKGLAEARTSYRSGTDGARLEDVYPTGKEAKGEPLPIQLFLSHKHKDQKAAEEIFSVLKKGGGNSLDIFMSKNIEKGTKWHEEIENQLDKSDWFLMLFSGTNDDWSWCYHEAGIFRGMKYPFSKRLVVLYPRSKNISIPDPLRDNQAVECHPDQPEHIYRLFNDLFTVAPHPGRRPINPFFASEENTSRKDDAKRIIDAVGSLVVRSITQENIMAIEILDLSSLSDQAAFPPDTRILGGSGALRLFDLGDDSDFSWAEFRDALDPEFRAGLDQTFWPALYRACAETHKSRRLASTHTIIRSPADGRHYMPMLSRVEITGNNSVTFHITFVQVAAGTQGEVRHKSVARIFTALRLAHRFRWEIIDPYRDLDRLRGFVEHQTKIRDRQGNGAVAANASGGLAVVWEAIRLLEIESQNRGVYDPQALPADFSPGADARVREMFALWEQHRGRLERAASEDDAATFSRVLIELDPINVEFISLASQRLGELVRADADDS
jgi:hypothetical protein